MYQAYPYRLDDAGNGAVMATFIDVPQALTQGADEATVVHWAADALHVALTGYIDHGADIPTPSKPKRGQKVAYLDPLVAMKLEIYQAMRDRRMTRVALAEAMGTDEKSVRRLLDLDHKSKVDQIVAALRVLGKALVVDVRDVVAG